MAFNVVQRSIPAIALDQGEVPTWAMAGADNAPMRAARNVASPVSLPGIRTPGAGFDEPFAMLAACHERVARSLDLLRRLVAHVETTGVDADARSAAHDVWRYFELAAPAHHADEEHHVLPRLRESSDLWLAAVARRIQADHDAMGATWQRLGPLLRAVHEGDAAAIGELRQLADAFVALYERHLPLEDDVAFPRVRERMGDAELGAMGDEMARRRQSSG
jgi:hemerythrin-like domain-containing protein